MLDWAFYLKYLQSILLEFDADGVLRESTMIKYFREGIKPSIQAEMEQCNRKLNGFKDKIQKTINVEAKAAFRSHSTIRETH